MLNKKIIKYSPQIDGLRAIAVLSVMIFHAFPGYLNGGFLGVDIFFVISGYLITRLILNKIENKEFTFKDFYYRRIKRIFPALLLILFFTGVFGLLVLFPVELKSLGLHIFGGVTFISNIILYNEISYFDPDSYLKPLLHLWSLAIEEQFYIIWPIVLFLFSKYSLNVFRLIFSILIISFLLQIFLIYTNSGLAFYLPFTRFWELMTGAMLSKIELSINNDRFERLWINLKEKLAKILSLSAFGLIILVMIFYTYFGENKITPYFITVLSTFIIIGFSEKTFLGEKILSNKILVYIGLISYPLYLWHWPILSFSFIISDGFPSGEIRLLLLIISFVLSVFTFNYVEKPIRFKTKKNINFKIVGGLITTMLFLASTGYFVFLNEGFTSTINNELKTNSSNIIVEDIKRKKISNKRIIIIGDSHAQQIAQSLEISGFSNIKVFSKGTCFPFLGVNTRRRPTRLWKQNTDCQPWVDNSYSEIENLIDDDVVIIACFYNQYLDGRILIDSGQEYKDDPIEIFKNTIKKTIDYLISINKSVILALDVPELDGPCMPPRPLNFVDTKNCVLKKENENLKSIIYSTIIKNISDNNKNVYMYDPRGALCDEDNCFGEIDGRYLYNSDGNHLSENGLVLLGNHFNKVYHSNFTLYNN